MPEAIETTDSRGRRLLFRIRPVLTSNVDMKRIENILVAENESPLLQLHAHDVLYPSVPSSESPVLLHAMGGFTNSNAIKKIHVERIPETEKQLSERLTSSH